MITQNNRELQLASDFICYTNRSVFLTGKAGTGKTTFLKNIKNLSPKRMVVVAPTGVAAINAGGVTIHSFFQLPFGPQIPETAYENSDSNKSASSVWVKRFSKRKLNIIKSLDLLVIDEISMVRADVLDAIDGVLRRFRNRYQPFGGLQLLMIGDLQQLAPVAKDEDWNILQKYYDTVYFFSSRALQRTNYTSIELKQIFRQSDPEFIRLLEKVRTNSLDKAGIELLKKRYVPDFTPGDNEGYITLTTHNYQAMELNSVRLSRLKTQAHGFRCTVEGEFPEQLYPAEQLLTLKTGAQVMFLRNDSTAEKRYYNGKIGKVIKIEDDTIEVLCPGESVPIVVEKEVWENIQYSLNEETAQVEENLLGRFIQFPLKLAWAITIHKSQGLTFEKAIIDAYQAFAHGQVYVALSRCKTLEGIVLRSPVDEQSLLSDQSVTGFIKKVGDNQPGESDLEASRKMYELQLIRELFNYEPALRMAGYLVKIIQEHEKVVMGNLLDVLVKLQPLVKTELIEVADKFYVQVESLYQKYGPLENNQNLKDRLKKASAYFIDKTGTCLHTPLKMASFTTDNRLISKQINDALDKLNAEIRTKMNCLNSAAGEFSISSYLTSRALSVIEPAKSNESREYVAPDLEHAELYKMLVLWRKRKSVETGSGEPQIIRQSVLAGITRSLPANVRQLKAVKGMGGKKMQEFGGEILAIVLEYRQKKGMNVPQDASEQILYAGLHTREISFRMFQNGEPIDAIAKMRGLAVSTIESHLVHFVRNGEIEVTRLISESKFDAVSHFIKNFNGIPSAEEIHNKLDLSLTYSEIRFALAALHQGAESSA